MFYRLGGMVSWCAASVYGRPDWDHKYDRAEVSENTQFEIVICPKSRWHQRQGARIGQLIVRLPSLRLGDCVWTWHSDCLVTDRTRRLIEEAGFTGVRFDAVEVEEVRGHPLEAAPRLWELAVTGTAGKAHPDSGIRVLQTCEACGMVKYSSFRNGIRSTKRSGTARTSS